MKNKIYLIIIKKKIFYLDSAYNFKLLSTLLVVPKIIYLFVMFKIFSKKEI